MSDDEVWARQPRVLETEMGDDISLYDPIEERVTVLNTTASDIWRLLDGETPVGEITRLLASSYAVDRSRIREDVDATLEELAQNDLLTRRR